MKNKIRLGNSRLLYQVQKSESADINEAVGRIDDFLLRSKQVELVREKIFLYPKQEGEELWIGREISGFPTQLPEGMGVEDFRAVEVLEDRAPKKSSTVAELVEVAISAANGQGKDLLRMVLDLESFDQPLLHLVEKSVKTSVQTNDKEA